MMTSLTRFALQALPTGALLSVTPARVGTRGVDRRFGKGGVAASVGAAF